MKTRYSVKRLTLRPALAASVLGALVGGGHAAAAVGTATTSATVMAPIVVNKAADLSFGRFSIGAGGTITVSTSGVRSASGVIPSSDGGTIMAAKFVVTGSDNATYSITHGGTTALTRSSGTDTMLLTKFSDNSAANSTTGNITSGRLTSGTESIYVGGTLSVGADQAPGDYTGLLSVAIEYN